MRLRSANQMLGAMAAAVAMVACSAPVATREPVAASVATSQDQAASPGNQGRGWEVVLPGGSTGPQLADGYEATRRDLQLARGPGSLIDESYWPSPAAYRLDRFYRFYLSDNPRQVNVFIPRPAWPYRPYPAPYWRW